MGKTEVGVGAIRSDRSCLGGGLDGKDCDFVVALDFLIWEGAINVAATRSASSDEDSLISPSSSISPSSISSSNVVLVDLLVE